MKIGIYGGTFHPIHRGHTEAAAAARDYLALDELCLVPTGLPPHKELSGGAVQGRHRLEMTRLAARELGAKVLDLELTRKGKSYTVDTLEQIGKEYPKAELFLLMGSDMFLTFPDWHRAKRIAKLCTLCAFARNEGDTREMLEAQAGRLRESLGARVVVVPLPRVIEISSTRLREMLARGEGQAYLSPAVYGYILREGLYGTHADLRHLTLEELRCVAMTMLKGSRVAHVLGCEETAAALARRWGADEELARRAALLHDCTKKLTKEQQLALCRQYGIDPDAVEAGEGWNLLHALTGAAVARDVFGLDEAGVSAIRWHTTGKPSMTRLEKIIYLADYIEPTRSFCDLTELRRLAFEDLDRAVLLGLEMALEDLTRKGFGPVHPNSVYARDYLKGLLI